MCGSGFTLFKKFTWTLPFRKIFEIGVTTPLAYSGATNFVSLMSNFVADQYFINHRDEDEILFAELDLKFTFSLEFTDE